jgi:hypothetical protein
MSPYSEVLASVEVHSRYIAVLQQLREDLILQEYGRDS